ncbi:MAG TPA: restriction endonuclease subunit S [Verrucomicrobiota bacterium]|jgi:type I restriction enzyme S subunit|nr:restriction endonuclease subunit S [Verrucomicrobiota bacterium]HQL78632.1 restriction endonuclease subunit S [Verrucomicrobiota bacterium]
MSANPETAAPTGRQIIARGNALGKMPPSNTRSPKGAKEGGELPTGWKLVRLGDIAQTTSGGTPRRDKPQYYGGTIPWVKSGELGDRVVYETSETLSGEGLASSNAKIFPKGTLCIALYGATVGKLGILGIDAATNQAVCAVFPPEGLDTRYLYRFFEGKRRELIKQGKGGAQSNISQGIIRDTLLPVPPLPEQRRIVAEIEKQFTRLEAGVAALRRVQANLKRYRAAVLKAACEGQLVPTEAELARQRVGCVPSRGTGRAKNAGSGEPAYNDAGYETGEQLLQRILAERCQWFARQQAGAKAKKKYVEPSQPETIKLPSLPDGWTWGTWNQLSNWVTYGFTRPMPHVDQGIPIITAKGVNRGRIDFDGAHLTTRDAFGKLSEKDRPQPGDVLITKDGTIGRAAVVDTDRQFCINQSVGVIWLRSCPMERKFLLTVIESELTQKPIWAKARGVAIQHLSITDFAKMALPIPPLAEQTRIVAEVERRLSVVEELESLVLANLQRAERLRQSILQKAFTGDML